jgi:hypothetical protein
MADLVKTLTSHLKLVAVGVGAVALFGGTATTISLADSSTPTGKPTTKPAPQANPHATANPSSTKKDTEDANDKNEPNGVRPTDTHGYCVSHAVAAAHAAGKTGQDIAAAAHSCKKANDHGKSATAPGHNK